MKVRHSNKDDVEYIMMFIHQAQDYFKGQGIDQWQDGYPDDKRIYDDIDLGHSYVLEDNNVLGTMYFALEDDPCYKKIYDGEWLTSDSYAVIHRIVIDHSLKGQNLASILLNYVIAECKNKNVSSIRIDTHEDNLSMQKFLNNNDFKLCGHIFLESGAKRLAFEKLIT